MNKGILLLIFAVAALHVPFLNADPDHSISFSRDAFTDEGLYTSQVRNYINTGTFNINESDAALKTPLFSLLMYAAFTIFGVSLTTARLVVLVLSLMAIYLVVRKERMLAIMLTMLVLFQFTIFHYTHLSLAEFIAVSSLFIAWYYMSNEHSSVQEKSNGFKVSFFTAVAMYLKFQFLYMILWPLIFYFLIVCINLILKSRSLIHDFRKTGFVILFTGVLMLIYYLGWYLPKKELFDFVLNAQASVVFGQGEWFRKMIDHNIEHYFMNENVKPFTILFLLCVILFPFILYRFRHNKQVIYQLLAAFCWCLLELHKPAMAYLPGRYLVSTFFAMGLFSVLITLGLYKTIANKKYAVTVLSLLLAWPVFANINQYFNSYQSRKYVLAEANLFVEKYTAEGCPVAGAWGPSLTWNTRSLSVPVWKDYFNDKNTMDKFKPCIVVAELNEEDSGEAWKLQGVDLSTWSGASYDFSIRDWKVRIFVSKEKVLQQ